MDYTFQVLNNKPLSKYDHEIQILLNGTTITLIKDDSGWRAKNQSEDYINNLADAIGKMLSLRYRIW